MPTINYTTTYSELKFQTGSSQTIVFDTPASVSIPKRLSGFFTGSTPVTDKMYSLVKARVKDHIVEKRGGQVNPDECQIDCIAQQLLCECGVRYRDLNKTDAIEKIFKKIEQNIIEFFESQPTQKGTKTFPDSSMRGQAAMLLAYLMGAPFDTKMINWQLIKAIFFQENNQFKNAFKATRADTLQDICLLINTGEVAPEQQRIYEILIGNILALIPFAEPEHDSEIRLPQKINGQWQLIDYKVEVLNLNPEWLGGSMPAVGLTPIAPAPEGAQRVLLFRGTSQPTGSVAFYVLCLPMRCRAILWENLSINTLPKIVLPAG